MFWIFYLSVFNSLVADDQTHEIVAARCHSKCLQVFIRYKSHLSKSGMGQTTRNPISDDDRMEFSDEMANQVSVTKQSMRLCLNDAENHCSKQCTESCSMSQDCICQDGSVGCLLSCFFRKEILKEPPADQCPVSLSFLNQQLFPCPKGCNSKADCSANQQCCSVHRCGPICLEIDNKSLPKYTPVPTNSSSASSIVFDWSDTFNQYFNKDSPLIFVLQTRTCLCKKFIENYASPWQTLIRTHLHGVKLNALDNGTVYLFRLAAVSSYGTNGFGPVSKPLPDVISHPLPPYPPDNMIEYKWQLTHHQQFRVEIRWKKPKESIWTNYEYQIIWLIDHGIGRTDGESVASFKQLSKAIPGSDTSTTIEELRASTIYNVQIFTKAYWPGFGHILSVPNVMHIRTPGMPSDFPELNTEKKASDGKDNGCMCSEKTQHVPSISIGAPIVLNGDLQIIVDMDRTNDYLVQLHPEVCIDIYQDGTPRQNNRIKLLYKNTAQIALRNLRYSCRYFMEISTLSLLTPNITYQICFCTPHCSDIYQIEGCPKEDISFLPSPIKAKSTLYNFDTMTYIVTWTSVVVPRNVITNILKYRILWAPRKFEPVPMQHYSETNDFYPIIDADQLDVKIVDGNITRLLLHNLTKEQLYIIRIQSIGLSLKGDQIESRPLTLFLPTFGFLNLESNSAICILMSSPAIFYSTLTSCFLLFLTNVYS